MPYKNTVNAVKNRFGCTTDRLDSVRPCGNIYFMFRRSYSLAEVQPKQKGGVW